MSVPYGKTTGGDYGGIEITSDIRIANASISFDYFKELIKGSEILDLIKTDIQARANAGKYAFCDSELICRMLGLDYENLKKVAETVREKTGENLDE